MSGIKNQTFTEEVERIPDNNSHEIPLELKETELYSVGNGEPDPRSKGEDKLRKKNTNCLTSGQNAIKSTIENNPKTMRFGWITIFNLAIFVYFGFATRHWYITYGLSFSGQWCNGYGMLLILFVIIYGNLIYVHVIKKLLGNFIIKCLSPSTKLCKSIIEIKFIKRFGRILFYLTVLVGVLIFMIIDTVDSRDRLVSLLGIIFLLSFGCIFSKYPGRINWSTVIWGLIIQFGFGLFSIRWSVGRIILQCIADKAATFLNYTISGAEFVFSETLVTTYAVFAFASLPAIFFFSFTVQILYYLGAMQWFVMKLGTLLQIVMGTTICESVTTVANIFLSLSESPLMIKPYIPSLTSSELHTVMTSGFATVSGTVLAAYIRLGAEPAHLITASIMAAPATLCFSKLFYPEIEESKTKRENIVLQKSTDNSILDAASRGAHNGVAIFLGVIANIVAFVSAIAFLNGVTTWFGVLVGYEDINFEWFLTKIFTPLAWLMGVSWAESETVASLIGLKTVVNEFAAYQRLGEYKNLNMLSSRSEAIATYAICGFSNPGSVGIAIGALTSMAPEKRPQITSVAIRALIAGSAVTFMTASIAGTLMTDEFYATIANNNSTS